MLQAELSLNFLQSLRQPEPHREQKRPSNHCCSFCALGCAPPPPRHTLSPHLHLLASCNFSRVRCSLLLAPCPWLRAAEQAASWKK